MQPSQQCVSPGARERLHDGRRHLRARTSPALADRCAVHISPGGPAIKTAQPGSGHGAITATPAARARSAVVACAPASLQPPQAPCWRPRQRGARKRRCRAVAIRGARARPPPALADLFLVEAGVGLIWACPDRGVAIIARHVDCPPTRARPQRLRGFRVCSLAADLEEAKAFDSSRSLKAPTATHKRAAKRCSPGTIAPS
jgi:hypothetical protein